MQPHADDIAFHHSAWIRTGGSPWIHDASPGATGHEKTRGCTRHVCGSEIALAREHGPRSRRLPPCSHFEASAAWCWAPRSAAAARVGCTSGGLEQVLATTREGEEVMARTVAVKIVDPAIGRDAEAMHELRRAVRRMALVQPRERRPDHRLFRRDFGTQRGAPPSRSPCIVQELVDGMSLAEFVARYEGAGRRMPLDLALFIACEIAEGLAGGAPRHERRGRACSTWRTTTSSPRQVLLSWNGEVKVGDFGWRPTGRASWACGAPTATCARTSPTSRRRWRAARVATGAPDVFHSGSSSRDAVRAALPRVAAPRPAREGVVSGRHLAAAPALGASPTSPIRASARRTRASSRTTCAAGPRARRRRARSLRALD